MEVPALNRRGFFTALAGGLAAAAFDPERLLWIPGRKLISIPAVAWETVVLREFWKLRPDGLVFEHKLDLGDGRLHHVIRSPWIGRRPPFISIIPGPLVLIEQTTLEADFTPQDEGPVRTVELWRRASGKRILRRRRKVRVNP